MAVSWVLLRQQAEQVRRVRAEQVTVGRAMVGEALRERQRQLQLVRVGAEGEAGAVGSLRLVDLAGSERKDTGNLTAESPERFEEMKAINSSLGCLKECIRLQLLRDTAADDTHVPYRRCKLTTLLKSSFVNHAVLPEAPPESVPRLCFLSHVAPLRSQACP